MYLMLVNDLIHGLFPEAVTIGEDVSVHDDGIFIIYTSPPTDVGFMSCSCLPLHVFQ